MPRQVVSAKSGGMARQRVRPTPGGIRIPGCERTARHGQMGPLAPTARTRSRMRSLPGGAEAVPGVDQTAHGTVGIVAQLVLPHDMDLPAAILQRVTRARVALDIAPELLGPERGVRPRPR